MGWSEKDALATDVNYILFAYKGRTSMLNAIFGSGEAREERKPPSAAEIRSFAKTHNALMQHGRIKGIPPKKRN